VTRGVGAATWGYAARPEWTDPIVLALTQLGATWWLLGILVLVYLVWPVARRQLTGLLGVWLAGIGIYRGLKAAFAAPRPARPPIALGAQWLTPDSLLYQMFVASSGYGFPSGHATNATIIYGGLAAIVVVRTGYLWQPIAAAMGVVAVAAFSRVALGVHHVIDVMAGIALGALLLFIVVFVGIYTDDPAPTTAFGVATGAGALALAIDLSSVTAGLVLVAIVGAVVAHLREQQLEGC